MNVCVLENLGTGWFLRGAFGHADPPWPESGVVCVHLTLVSNSDVWGYVELDLMLGAPLLTLPFRPVFYQTLTLTPEQRANLDAEVARRGGVRPRGVYPELRVTASWEVL